MNKLELSIEVYKNLTERSVTGRIVEGVLPAEKYASLLGCLVTSDLLQNSIDSKCLVEFRLPRESEGVFVLNINELLNSPRRLLNPPEKFYIADMDYSSWSPIEIEVVSNYKRIAELSRLLCNLSDHCIETEPKAIFLQEEKVELYLNYGVDDLKPLSGLDSFISEFINAEIHKEQKATIIKGVLLEMLRSDEIDRFSIKCLIRRFPEFLERVKANYQLYVSEFSFEKIKAQVEKEKFEYTLKLNSVFSDIQNQLLAIPVALVLVGSQMSSAEHVSLKNILIWMGSIVFGFFISLLIRNQRNTLRAIKNEIDVQWKDIRGKHRYVAERLESSYTDLQNRTRTQKTYLFFIDVIVAGSILLTTILFLYFSDLLDSVREVVCYGAVGGVIYILIYYLFFRDPEIS